MSTACPTCDDTGTINAVIHRWGRNPYGRILPCPDCGVMSGWLGGNHDRNDTTPRADNDLIRQRDTTEPT